MRIGIDMLAMQSPHHGHRGIGRFGANLVSSMLRRDDEHEYVFYVHADLPTARVPNSPRAMVRTIRPRWHIGETMTPLMDRLAANNADRLDTFLVISPFEQWSLYGPPAKPGHGLRMASVVHDLIPFLFQNENDPDPLLKRHYRVLEELTRYDVLLANSEATRQDVLSFLKRPPEQVVTISAGSDPSYFVPDQLRPPSTAKRRLLADLGINRPFLFNVGGLDDRKNTWKLIDAFTAFPESLRRSHQLVLTFWLSDWGRCQVIDYTERLSLGDALVLTGEVSDDTLKLLYQQCEAFVFPSAYEGFGLPLLEAMHCGAPVIAGNNSSQIEVVGDAGLLAEVNNVDDLTSKISRVLSEPDLAQELRKRALTQSSNFSWERSAERAVEALAGPIVPRLNRRVRFDRAHSRKPTIALFSPFPPRRSGISDYSAFLLNELRQAYRIDLYHDSGYVPDPALTSADFMACDYGLFDRFAAAKDYHAIVYQMGNSRYHHFMYNTMLRHPGVVTLHDFFLAGFHLHYGHKFGLGFNLLRDELLRWYPEDCHEIEAASETWTEDWDAAARDCARRGWYLNRRTLDASVLTVLHSVWCARQVETSTPDYSDKVVVIPLGTQLRRVSETRRAEVRERFAIPNSALVIGSYGFIHPDKLLIEALAAFREIARTDEKALYLFVGEEADGGEVRRHAARLGLQERVRFLGRQSAEAFADLLLVTDIGVNLRMPPTNGETSAALLQLLAAGVPTVVTDVATFSDYPADVVCKVRWETEGLVGLTQAIVGLASCQDARESLRRAAWAYVERHHEWSRVAKLYVNAIERCHELTRSPGTTAIRARRKTMASM